MSKFKIGDVVIGNDLADKEHSITKKGWIGIVRDIVHQDLIKVSGVTIYIGTVVPNWLDNNSLFYNETFSVNPNCFDYLDYEPRTMPVIKTKEGLLDDLSRQRDCYYSLSQVVDMIKNLEDPKPVPVTSGQIMILEEDYNAFVDEVVDHFDEKLRYGQELVDLGYGQELVDLESAEFSLCGNEISLDSVDIYKDDLSEMVQNSLDKVLSKYVTCIEKSVDL